MYFKFQLIEKMPILEVIHHVKSSLYVLNTLGHTFKSLTHTNNCSV